MTAPVPAPPPPAHPPAAAPGSRPAGRWKVPLIVAVLAGGAGVGLGWLLWAGGSDSASGTDPGDARADAAGACQAYGRVPELSAVFSDTDSTSRSRYERVEAAASLARSAATLDDRYDDLDKALQNVARHVLTFNLKGAEAKSAHEKVRSLCAPYGD